MKRLSSVVAKAARAAGINVDGAPIKIKDKDSALEAIDGDNARNALAGFAFIAGAMLKVSQLGEALAQGALSPADLATFRQGMADWYANGNELTKGNRPGRLAALESITRAKQQYGKAWEQSPQWANVVSLYGADPTSKPSKPSKPSKSKASK